MAKNLISQEPQEFLMIQFFQCEFPIRDSFEILFRVSIRE